MKRGTIHNVSNIVISKIDMKTFGTIDVEVTTTKGEKFTLECFHDKDAPITLKIGE